MPSRLQSGFNPIELMIVTAIIGILAAAADTLQAKFRPATCR